jgi:hypothetical protein
MNFTLAGCCRLIVISLYRYDTIFTGAVDDSQLSAAGQAFLRHAEQGADGDFFRCVRGAVNPPGCARSKNFPFKG